MDGMNVSTMLKRLEAAASRLEDVVLFAELRRSAATQDDQLTGLRTDSGSVISPRSSKPSMSTAVPPLPAKAPVPAGIEALVALKSGPVAEFVALSDEVAPGVGAQARAFADAYNEMLRIASLAPAARKPDDEQLVALLLPLNEAASKVEDVRNEFFKEREIANFLATVPAGVGALGWITMQGKNEAAPFVLEMRDSAQFYANRVLKDSKDNRPWVQAFIGVLNELAKIVKEHYASGLEWNSGGVSVAEAAAISPQSVSGVVSPVEASPAAASPAAASPASSGPPPPPPPSVSQLVADVPAAPAASTESSGGLTGVFAELNQGSSIASGLKPKTKSLKASKPPIPKSTKPKPTKEAAPAPAASAKPLRARVELVESTWYVEDLREQHDVEVTASMGQSVQIDNCAHCTIKILGKFATFNMSRCTHVGLLVDTMVASCDIVNCSNFGLQVTGTLPSLMLDQASNGQVYLSKESLGVDIFTSQTNAINVNIPEEEEGAYREVPLGEQILHNIVDGKVKSSVVKHA